MLIIKTAPVTLCCTYCFVIPLNNGHFRAELTFWATTLIHNSDKTRRKYRLTDSKGPAMEIIHKPNGRR